MTSNITYRVVSRLISRTQRTFSSRELNLVACHRVHLANGLFGALLGHMSHAQRLDELHKPGKRYLTFDYAFNLIRIERHGSIISGHYRTTHLAVSTATGITRIILTLSRTVYSRLNVTQGHHGQHLRLVNSVHHRLTTRAIIIH